MVTVGGQSVSVSGVNSTFTLNSNLYAACQRFNAKWGNKLDEEGVAGTDIPIIITNVYHGEGTMEIIYSTENTGANEQFAKLMTPTNGAISAFSLVWTGKDVGGPTTRTFTLTGTLWPKETEWDFSNPGKIAAKISFILTARPTLT